MQNYFPNIVPFIYQIFEYLYNNDFFYLIIKYKAKEILLIEGNFKILIIR